MTYFARFNKSGKTTLFPVQQVHDDVLNTAKIDNKFQKDTFNAICAFANRVAQEKGFDSAWFAREKIYRPLMEK